MSHVLFIVDCNWKLDAKQTPMFQCSLTMHQILSLIVIFTLDIFTFLIYHVMIKGT